MKKVTASEYSNEGYRTSDEVVGDDGKIITCDLCGAEMLLSDYSESNQWWLNCPHYATDPKGEHDSYLVEIEDYNLAYDEREQA
jgi:hypothetical protein